MSIVTQSERRLQQPQLVNNPGYTELFIKTADNIT